MNSSSKSVADDDRPWADVCTPYARCINTAFKTGNVNELRASVYACFICLLLKDNRGIFMVEDPQLRSFLDQFRRTLIYQALTTTPDTQQQQQNITDPEFIAIQQRVMYGVSRGGFSDVRQVLIAFAFDLTASTFLTITDPATLDITSNSASKSPEKDTFNSIAKRSFDFASCTAILNTLWQRINDSTGRNWKYGLKALKLLYFLLSSGSEMVVASVWNNLGLIHNLTRFSTDAIGVTARSVARVRESAWALYARAINLNELRWLRSIEGHEIIRGIKKTKLEVAVPRVPKFQGLAKTFFTELHTRTCEPPSFDALRLPPQLPPRPNPSTQQDLTVTDVNDLFFNGMNKFSATTSLLGIGSKDIASSSLSSSTNNEPPEISLSTTNSSKNTNLSESEPPPELPNRPILSQP